MEENYSQDETDAAFVDLVKGELDKEKRHEKFRVSQAETEAKDLAGKEHPTLGKCVASIPARDYFRLVNKYGIQEVHSPKFLKYFQQNFGNLSPNKLK
jgi:hypothetical protein